MRLVVFNEDCVGVMVHGETLVDLRASYAAYSRKETVEPRIVDDETRLSSLLGLLSGGKKSLELANSIVNRTLGDPERTSARLLSIHRVKLRAPLPSLQSRIICAGGNFASHHARVRGITVTEAENQLRQMSPWGCCKLPHCVIGPTDNIVYPDRTRQLDYEVEVAAVLGCKAKDASPEEAEKSIFGYTILIDYSLRDVQEPQAPFSVPLAKNFDTAASMGPVLVLKDEVIDPYELRMRLWVNGQLRQEGNTREMIRRFPELIAWYSRDLTLYPGDIISGGKCAGTGLEKRNRENDFSWFLRPGDTVEAEVGNVGVIRNGVAQKGGST